MAPIGTGSDRENSGSGPSLWLNNHKPAQYIHNLISGYKVQMLDYTVKNKIPRTSRSTQKKGNKQKKPWNNHQFPVYLIWKFFSKD